LSKRRLSRYLLLARQCLNDAMRLQMLGKHEHCEKMEWFATSLATKLLSCNDHLQFIAIQPISMGVNVTRQVTWVATHVTHFMWNHIHMQFEQLSYNYVGTTIVQL
jgi:hypothetical protein